MTILELLEAIRDAEDADQEKWNIPKPLYDALLEKIEELKS